MLISAKVVEEFRPIEVSIVLYNSDDATKLLKELKGAPKGSVLALMQRSVLDALGRSQNDLEDSILKALWK